MPCGCKKREPIVQNPRPVEETPTILTGMTYDWYNNIDEIEPIKKDE